MTDKAKSLFALVWERLVLQTGIRWKNVRKDLVVKSTMILPAYYETSVSQGGIKQTLFIITFSVGRIERSVRGV